MGTILIIILLIWCGFELHGINFMLDQISNKMAALHTLTSNTLKARVAVEKIKEKMDV